MKVAILRDSARRASGRREFGRRSTFKHAAIVSESGEQTLCIVTDISDTDAVLKVDDSIDLPRRFGLMIQDDDFTVRCEMIERASGKVRVQFISSPRRLSWFRNQSQIAARASAGILKSTE